MSRADYYEVKAVRQPLNFEITVPGSKSITNRAMLLAALSESRVRLENVLFSDDTRHFMKCLIDLGFEVEDDEPEHMVTIGGSGGKVPVAAGKINVGSAGTAARFLTALLAAASGEYLIEASAQMEQRPMKPLLEALRRLGTKFSFLKKEDFLPYKIQATGLKGGSVSLDAGVSSQFLSALLMVGPLSQTDLEIGLDGKLAAQPYIEMTLRMMAEFGVKVDHEKFERFFIKSGQSYQGRDYWIEPDVSNANYFLAMAALTGGSVLVKGVKFDSLQGDIKFLEILQQMGCQAEERAEGIYLKGPAEGRLIGVEADLGGMPDQALTLAALAPFAVTPTVIRNVSIIKHHETNRMAAIVNELTKLAVGCSETGDGLIIYPGNPHPAEIETYDDHRVAMAFSLLGLRTPGIIIKNPGCTGKTFENYFELFDKITKF